MQYEEVRVVVQSHYSDGAYETKTKEETCADLFISGSTFFSLKYFRQISRLDSLKPLQTSDGHMDSVHTESILGWKTRIELTHVRSNNDDNERLDSN
jgi:hypothetical protein